MNTIMRACFIIHNMILEDKRHIDVHEFEETDDPPISTNHDVPEIQHIMNRYAQIMDKDTSRNLQQDIVEHHWNVKGCNTHFLQE
jgi:hypothetical protein